jgi:hypothetical protein
MGPVSSRPHRRYTYSIKSFLVVGGEYIDLVVPAAYLLINHFDFADATFERYYSLAALVTLNDGATVMAVHRYRYPSGSVRIHLFPPR